MKETKKTTASKKTTVKEAAKDTVKKVEEATAPVAKAVKEAAAPAAKAVKEAAAPAAKAMKEATAPMAKAVKKEVEKTAAKAKTVAKKATSKKEVEATLSVQFAGKSYTTQELVAIAKDVWQYDLKQKASDFKNVELYVKPEENQAYYVINGEHTGSFFI